MTIAISVVAVMGTVGIVFGFILAYVNKKFSVEINPLIHIVEDILPKGQCGACGYPGCMAYAEAVVLDPTVAPNLCAPGKDAIANRVAELTGKVAAPTEPKVAVIKCQGVNARKSFEYEGIRDCVAANLVMGGDKACKYGCLGYGSCVSACTFDAITETGGIPHINEKACTSCGKCVKVCPRKVISLEPEGYHVSVKCNSKDKGPVAKKNCDVPCIGCGLCGKNCPHGAIKVENSLAIVDSTICEKNCKEATCIAKCPTKAIIEKVGK